MKETIEVETGFGSSEAEATVRIYATDLVLIAKAMTGHEYIDLSITSGIRRIANINMLANADVTRERETEAVGTVERGQVTR